MVFFLKADILYVFKMFNYILHFQEGDNECLFPELIWSQDYLVCNIFGGLSLVFCAVPSLDVLDCWPWLGVGILVPIYVFGNITVPSSKSLMSPFIYTHSLFRFNHPVPLPLTYNLCLVAYIPSIWCSSLCFLMKFNFSFMDLLQCCCFFPWLIGWQIRRDLSNYFGLNFF